MICVFCPGCGTALSGCRLVDPSDHARDRPPIRVYHDCDRCRKSWRITAQGLGATDAALGVLADAVSVVIQHPGRYAVATLPGHDLTIERHENGQFCLSRPDSNGNPVEVFSVDSHDTIRRFLLGPRS